LEKCRKRPEIFINAARDSDVGPLQALIDELEFNVVVAKNASRDEQGCLFVDEQFRRVMRAGAIAILHEELKQKILEAYVSMGRANQRISAVLGHHHGSHPWAESADVAMRAIAAAGPKIQTARDAILRFLSSEM
jgi:hypothetical protein